MIVVRQQKIVGNKDAIRDAYKLAENMRIGAAKPIFKQLGQYKRLKSLTHTYSMVQSDTVRIQRRVLPRPKASLLATIDHRFSKSQIYFSYVLFKTDYLFHLSALFSPARSPSHIHLYMLQRIP